MTDTTLPQQPTQMSPRFGHVHKKDLRMLLVADETYEGCVQFVTDEGYSGCIPLVLES